MQKMKKFGKFSAVAALALALAASACGRWQHKGSSGRGGDIAAPGGNEAPPSLLGTWETGCLDGGGEMIFGGVARNARYTFTADHTVLLSNVIYSDHACNSEMVKMLITGSYSLGSAQSKVPGSYDLDLKGATSTLSLLDPAKKVVNPCGTGEFYLHGNQSCGAVADSYQVVKVTGKTMQLGNDDDTGVGSSPSERPKTLRDVTYTKVE